MANIKLPTGFVAAPTEGRKRLIVSVEGEDKTGKNHWAFTAPGPIAVFSLDEGLEGTVEKFVRGEATVNGLPHARKDVYVWNLELPDTQAGGSFGRVRVGDPDFDYGALWDRFTKAYSDLLKGGQVRTIIWDTAGEVYELQRLYRFGKLGEVQSHMWGPVKAEYVSLIRKAYDSDVNLILLHKMKAEYKNDGPTGGRERHGYTDMPFIAQVIVKTFREDDDDGEGSEFSVKVKSCRQNAGINGKVYEGMECSFPELASEVLEWTGVEDWA